MPAKSIYNQRLGREVARKAQSVITDKVHVIAGVDNVWSVVPEGTTRAVRNFRSQQQAISFARQYAGTEVIVHAENGAVRKKYRL